MLQSIQNTLQNKDNVVVISASLIVCLVGIFIGQHINNKNDETSKPYDEPINYINNPIEFLKPEAQIAPVTQPEMPLTQPEMPLTQPEMPLTQPEMPLTQPEIPLTQPEMPVTQPEMPVTQPEMPFSQPAQLKLPEKNIGGEEDEFEKTIGKGINTGENFSSPNLQIENPIENSNENEEKLTSRPYRLEGGEHKHRSKKHRKHKKSKGSKKHRKYRK
jgi:hypothetical protein